jgi:hypothetical protein
MIVNYSDAYYDCCKVQQACSTLVEISSKSRLDCRFVGNFFNTQERDLATKIKHAL